MIGAIYKSANNIELTAEQRESRVSSVSALLAVDRNNIYGTEILAWPFGLSKPDMRYKY